MNIAFHTLGCKLNFSETSFIANDLKNNGFNEVEFNEVSDIYVINTCTVTENANKECKYLVRKVLRQNKEARVIVMGCYAQLKPKEIQKIKGIDLILGNNEKFKLKKYLSNYSKNKNAKIIKTETAELMDFKSAFSFGNRTRSFLKIQDGCNYKCTFCTIPLARGINRSDEIKNIIKKIDQLKKSGVKEIVLTGVNIGDFKTKNNKKLIDLLKEIDLIDNIRVRISSIEPNLITSEIIDLISKSNTFVPHFHIPLQSGSDTILKAMKRRYLTKKYKDLIKELNSKIKNVCIGVDVIVGFPGETEDFFDETLSFLKNINISYLHVFSYSERENTEAIKLNESVPIKIRKYRSKVLRNLSDKKKRLFYNQNIGLIKEVLFENKKDDGYIYGFTDNYIKIKTKYQNNLENKFQKVKIQKIKNEVSTCAEGLII
ncbi:MAG: tRNA (N(6)-L-threonylcarbamoyladenosine(37)-C(2))-methylthiotransferase MtaB [Flavobacteriales bacterium]|nr:tRNA (N(6)-L-threonylcarbamoyladenosine(37)-C(2))-methylthiotransferase MtaB [Flavobacteriales bacterium]